MNDLHFVSKAEFVRALDGDNDPYERCALFATLCRINTLYMIARAGSGHIGSSFSCLDMVAWLYLNELRSGSDGTPHDVFFSSKGHDAPGLYSVLIGLGLLPFEKLETLRKLGGLPGHPDVSIPHIAANTGSLGMGISKAKGMIHAERLLKRDRRIYVMTGDGELQEGQIWESLRGAAIAGMGELSVIVDHNKIQSDHWVANTSDLGDLESRFASFGWHVQRGSGHDPEAFGKMLDCARVDARPSVIIADTVKGRGVSFMEPDQLGPHELYRYHSGAPSPEDYERALNELVNVANAKLRRLKRSSIALESRGRNNMKPAGNAERLIPAYAEALLAGGRAHENLIALDADLVLDCGLIPFRTALPNRYIECGIAEQDMVSQAGGLALRGMLPVVHSFACFLTSRANEQMYANATEGTKIIYVGSLGGLLPAGPGHSHQSLRDIALTSCIPGMTAFEPSCASEATAAISWMIEHADGPCYLRLVSIPVELTFMVPDNMELQPGRGHVLHDGSEAVVFAYGPVMLSEAVAAAEYLARNSGPSLKVVNLPWLNRIDSNWLRECVVGTRHVFTIDNHYLAGGQGERIAASIAELGLPAAPRVCRIGLDGVPVCGKNDQVLVHHRLDRASLARQFLNVCQPEMRRRSHG